MNKELEIGFACLEASLLVRFALLRAEVAMAGGNEESEWRCMNAALAA